MIEGGGGRRAVEVEGGKAAKRWALALDAGRAWARVVSGSFLKEKRRDCLLQIAKYRGEYSELLSYYQSTQGRRRRFPVSFFFLYNS
jgi:hypothetical protein